MSTQARNTLIPTIVIVAALFFGTGLLGHLTHKLDTSSTVLLILVFVIGSALFTWLTVWNDRKTCALLVTITASLSEHGLSIHKSKDGTYAVFNDSAPFTDVILTEDLSIDELESFTDGFLQGVLITEARQYDEEMESRLARQSAQHEEDRAHIGTFGQYVDIPGLED